MLLRMAVVDGIVEGRFDRVYRRWTKPHAKTGGRQRTPRGELSVDSVDVVTMGSLTADDARKSGHATLAALKAELRKRSGKVYRIGLSYAGEDPRVTLRNNADLSDEDVATLVTKLDRKDRVGEPWTRQYLRLLDENPEVRAADLAAGLGLDKPTFKRRIRQLKELGLTISFSPGYRLSPRGKALLARLSVLALAVAVVTGCPSASEPPPEPTPVDLGWDPGIAAGPGEARAGIVREGAEDVLFGGVNAEGRAGDIKLYNDRVQLVIQGAHRSHGIVDIGGHIIDADLVGNGVGRDTLEDQFIAFGLGRLFHADSVEVVSDGTDGGDAVVRSVGTDVTWQYLTGLFEREEPTVPPLGLRIEQEVRLPPDAWTATLTVTFTNESSEPVAFEPRDGVLSSGEDLHQWAPGAGLAGPEDDERTLVGVTGETGEATLSLWPATGTFRAEGLGALGGDLGITTVTHPQITLAPGTSQSITRYFAVAPDIATAEAERLATQGTTLATVSGRVLEGAEGVAGARVWFTDSDAAHGFAITDTAGAWSARLPVGETFSAWPVAQAHDEMTDIDDSLRYGPQAAPAVQERHLERVREGGPAFPWAVGRATPAATELTVAAGVELDLQVPPRSSARFALADSDGAPLPGVVEIRAVDVPTTVPEALWDAFAIPSGLAMRGWTASGTLDVPLPPGTYRAVVGHGQRHAQARIEEIVVAEGQTVEVPVVLAEQIPRDGWLTLDSHLHAAPSMDGALGMAHRLVTCAATGVDLPILTDHDRLVDYAPLAEALGLDALMKTTTGVEVTSTLRGHINLYPITPRPDEPNGGAEPWWEVPRDTQDLFDRMHARHGTDVITQVNHPRTPGMFTVAQFDAQEGAPRNDDFWSWDWQTFELLNGGVVDLPQVRADWFGMLNAGHARVPMGSSDSHYSYIPCGWGRTDVLIAAGAEGVTDADIVEALLAGRVIVAGGTTLRATLDLGAGPVLPGETTSGTVGAFQVVVRAPDWVEPGTLRVHRDGEVLWEQALTTSTDGVWFDGEIPVSADGASWFTVEVEGTQGVADLWRGFAPYAMTNAFFVE